MSPNPEVVLLVGAGPVAVEYAKVLQDLGVPFVVVGRGADNAAKFAAAVGTPAATGGLDRWLDGRGSVPSRAIVAVTENALGAACCRLMDSGVRSILVEKPGGSDPDDIRAVAAKAAATGARVFVGYNRRFYASVRRAREIIGQDGGVRSFSFEFTEWSHVIAGLEKAPGVKEQWFLHNSSHVIDLAFHLGGWPRELACYSTGGLPWHPTASVFAGAGVSESGAVFSYQANWEAPGRWGVEVLTGRHRLILRPMEKLQIQNIGSVSIEPVPLDDGLDARFKPGFHLQTLAFLEDRTGLLTIGEQAERLSHYLRISGRRA